MANKPMTLCLIHESPRILLGMKKRGFGAGRWNGFGGKLAPGESIEEAARREVLEEIGVTISEQEEVGVIEFEFQGNPEILEVHIFAIRSYTGEPTESEEMKPQWFTTDSIPFTDMWPDDPYWMPLFLAGQKFRGHFLFGEKDAILEQTLTVVDTL